MFPHLPPSSFGVCAFSPDVIFGAEVVSSGFSEVGMVFFGVRAFPDELRGWGCSVARPVLSMCAIPRLLLNASLSASVRWCLGPSGLSCVVAMCPIFRSLVCFGFRIGDFRDRLGPSPIFR